MGDLLKQIIMELAAIEYNEAIQRMAFLWTELFGPCNSMSTLACGNISAGQEVVETARRILEVEYE